MSYSNGSVGTCACGKMAVTGCERCGKAVCEAHAHEVPEAPPGVSADAAAHFSVAVRLTHGPTCQECRAQLGHQALHQVVGAPRAPLPAHWLDRAMALSSDSSRSDLEKAEDAELPAALTPTDVAEEFLRRMEQGPRERAPISESTVLRKPEYVDGWSVDCRRTEYTAAGNAGRRRLPCLISVHGELLGPVLEDDRASAQWWIVEDGDIDMPRLVSSVANILMLSAFVTETPEV
jgi:hypothetical protein